MKKAVIGALLFLGALSNAYGSRYVVWGTTISFYAQSGVESNGHLIRSAKGIFQNGEHPWCKNSAWIDPEDETLIAMAMSAAYSGQPINFAYEDAPRDKNDQPEAGRTIAFHEVSRCKVISIWH